MVLGIEPESSGSHGKNFTDSFPPHLTFSFFADVISGLGVGEGFLHAKLRLRVLYKSCSHSPAKGLFCAGDCGLGNLLGEQNKNIYPLLVLPAKEETMAGVRSEPRMRVAGSRGC